MEALSWRTLPRGRTRVAYRGASGELHCLRGESAASAGAASLGHAPRIDGGWQLTFRAVAWGTPGAGEKPVRELRFTRNATPRRRVVSAIRAIRGYRLLQFRVPNVTNVIADLPHRKRIFGWGDFAEGNR